MKLQLQVGKKYRRRDGEVVEVTGYKEDHTWMGKPHPFAVDTYMYMADGKYNGGFAYESDLDLIEEVPSTKDDNMKQFDLAAVDKLTALCSEGRQQVKGLLKELLPVMGVEVKKAFEPTPGQVWKHAGGGYYFLVKYEDKYIAASVYHSDGNTWNGIKDSMEEVTEGLTYAYPTLEAYFKAKLGVS